MELIVDIEDTTIVTKNKRGKEGTYDQQKAFAHLVDRDGKPNRYPREISVFPPKKEGKSVPYAKGQYRLSASSFTVDEYGGLKLGFINLEPVEKAAKV